jgi:hypothetical protein
MTDDGQHELPAGTWCLRLVLGADAVDAAALQWAIFPDDPRPQFIADCRALEDRLRKPRAPQGEKGPGWLLACWNRLFRAITGDRVYIVTSTHDNALTTNERDGHKWFATKAVRVGTAEVCWCIPFDVATGQVVEIRLDAGNRTDLSNLAEDVGAA